MSKMMDKQSLIDDGIVPSELADDPVIEAVCKDTRLTVNVRVSFIILYVGLVKEV
jgi:hypothetical protein